MPTLGGERDRFICLQASEWEEDKEKENWILFADLLLRFDVYLPGPGQVIIETFAAAPHWGTEAGKNKSGKKGKSKR